MGKQIRVVEVGEFEASLCQEYLCWRNMLDNENQGVFVWLVIAAQNFCFAGSSDGEDLWVLSVIPPVLSFQTLAGQSHP